MIISFKLETDPSILSEKCWTALKKYSHHLVIGNLLNSRKWEVLFVSAAGGEKWLRVPAGRRTKSVTGRTPEPNENVRVGEPAIEIESWIIHEIDILHSDLVLNLKEKHILGQDTLLKKLKLYCTLVKSFIW